MSTTIALNYADVNYYYESKIQDWVADISLQLDFNGTLLTNNAILEHIYGEDENGVRIRLNSLISPQYIFSLNENIAIHFDMFWNVNYTECLLGIYLEGMDDYENYR